MCADRQTHQIDGVSHGPGFVEVIDAPNQAAFDVAPGSEIFYVKIADREHVRRAGKLRTDFRPELRPTIIRGAQEHEDVRLHVGVFEAQIPLIDLSAFRQPVFELARGLDYVHAGNDSGAGNMKSNARPPSPETYLCCIRCNSGYPREKSWPNAFARVSPLTRCAPRGHFVAHETR